MNIQYFAIYDKKSLSYGQAFPSMTFGSAERSFKDSVNQSDTPHSKYPEDFTLYYLFTLDDETGRVEQDDPPRVIVEALALKNQGS